jgi:hypothetical protein
MVLAIQTGVGTALHSADVFLRRTVPEVLSRFRSLAYLWVLVIMKYAFVCINPSNGWGFRGIRALLF